MLADSLSGEFEDDDAGDSGDEVEGVEGDVDDSPQADSNNANEANAMMERMKSSWLNLVFPQQYTEFKQCCPCGTELYRVEGV